MTDIAALARENAISLEVKKDSLRQMQNGDWRVSFTVQGVDMDERITRAAMGTRFVAVLVEVNDDELPVSQTRREAMPNSGTKSVPTGQHNARPQPDIPPAGAKRPWRDFQPAQQAGMRCVDPVFIAFLKVEYADDWREFGNAADLVRTWCNVASRSELNTNQKSRMLWHQLDDQYQAWKALEHA